MGHHWGQGWGRISVVAIIGIPTLPIGELIGGEGQLEDEELGHSLVGQRKAPGCRPVLSLRSKPGT